MNTQTGKEQRYEQIHPQNIQPGSYVNQTREVKDRMTIQRSNNSKCLRNVGEIHNLLDAWKVKHASLYSDLELARAAGAGDFVSFEEIYRRHHQRVYAICFRMLRNAAETEDLVQDVFVQLHRKINSFRGDSAFTTWLYRLAVNEVLMHFRRRNVKFEKTTNDGTMPLQIVSGTEDPKRMSVFDKIALNRAISRLSAGYRKVFVLHDVEGYEHEEVARILGCSSGTSKSQLHKARLKLRKLLAARAPLVSTNRQRCL